MTTTNDILRLVADEIADAHNITITPRFTRRQELGDLSDAPQFYVEPTGFEIERRNVGAPRQIYRVRGLSQECVAATDYETIAREREEFWEKIAYDLVRRPLLDYNAFVRRVGTFPDAPSGYDASALEDGVCALSAGIEIEIVVD